MKRTRNYSSRQLSVAMGIFFLAMAGCAPLALPPAESLPSAPTETALKLLGLPADPIFHRSMHAGEQAFNRGNYATAEHYRGFKRAKETAKENPRADYDIAWAASYLFDAYVRQEKYGEAEQLFRASLTVIEKRGPKREEYLRRYAILLQRMGRETEAAEIEARANAIRGGVPSTPTPQESIEAKRGSDCRLSVQPSPGGNVLLIKGEGFAPHQDIRLVGRSDGEVIESRERASGEGAFTMFVFPVVKGKSGGTYSLTASTALCQVTIHHKWGDALLPIEAPDRRG